MIVIEIDYWVLGICSMGKSPTKSHFTTMAASVKTFFGVEIEISQSKSEKVL